MGKLTIKIAQIAAHKKDGKCLSTQYINNKSPLEWQCSEGHTWLSPLGEIRRGRWCRRCGWATGQLHRKFTIQHARAAARKRGGKCLSKNYVNVNAPLQWECAEGHTWTAPLSRIKRSWCRWCAATKAQDRNRYTIEDARKWAKRRKGKCLSTEYTNSITPLKWQCELGHKWSTQPFNVIRGSWCPTCGVRKGGDARRLSIKDAQKTACERKGKCLSKVYKGTVENLRWECELGHRWSATYGNIRMGGWCKKCKTLKSRRTIEEMQAWARKKGGKCISTKYINAHSKLKWECAKRHIWKSNAQSVFMRGTWCPYCTHSVKLTLGQLREYAKQKGGKCHAKKYVNNRQNVEWECHIGHTWAAQVASVIGGTWCPHCEGGVHERITRAVFEHITGESFPKAGPSWLMGRKGRTLTLDGYSDKLRTAFEYQGYQHYNESFHSQTKERWHAMKSRDRLKRRLCKKNKVLLVCIPHTVRHDKLQGYIINKCRRLGIPLTKNHKTPVSLKKASAPDRLEEFRQIAKKKGGKLLSTIYINSNTPLRFECKRGHTWSARPGNVKHLGNWCPFCAHCVKLTLGQMRGYAKKKKGKCLSKRYVNTKTPLKWQCAEGHIWRANGGDIMYKGSWCPECSLIKNRIRLIKLNKEKM